MMSAIAVLRLRRHLLLLLLGLQWSAMAQKDLQCLSEFRQSVGDPQGYLRSWSNISNVSNACLSTGVTCLHPTELKVYQLALPSAGLSGTFPAGLDKCGSLTALDLSGNLFVGPMPDNLCAILPYLVKLDLSSNKLGGSLPDLGNCQYLNELHLQDNQLQGMIPAQIGLLQRLRVVNLSGNKLQGAIPNTMSRFDKSAFESNAGLCGDPLKSCSRSGPSIGLIVSTTVVGLLVVAALTTGVLLFVCRKQRPQRMKDDTTWWRKIKNPRSIFMSMFEKPLVGIRFSDLITATDSFSKDNVIAEGTSGVSYKATLRDGSVLAVKRLKAWNKSDQQFAAEVEALGSVYHSNLVPLLGYCVAGPERLLIYKHMSGGSLYAWLFEADAASRSSSSDKQEWPARLKIALGAARGLAFLHHSCDPRILHRSISPHSILLDDDLEARITDFGLARILAPSSSSSSSQVNQEMVSLRGEAGHAAPEYERVPVATTKGDVYSFGVVLLELLTGQRADAAEAAGEPMSGLVQWVAALRGAGRAGEAVDKSLRSSISSSSGSKAAASVRNSSSSSVEEEEVMQVLDIACCCCLAPTPADRPSMYQVFQQLRAAACRYDFTGPDDDIPLLVR